MLKKLFVLAALLLPACFAHAHEYKAGALEIAHPWSQELPPNAPTVAAYFIIHNTGKSADRLLSDGKRFPMTLHFEKAGDVTVDVAVQKKPPESTQAHVHAQ